MEEKYIILQNPTYNSAIRKLQDSDPASASAVFNPLFARLIENIHYLYLRQTSQSRHIIASRVRDPNRPAYGLEGGGTAEPAAALLDVGPETGGAAVAAIVSGTAYDANNMSAGGGAVPDGTLILTKLGGLTGNP